MIDIYNICYNDLKQYFRSKPRIICSIGLPILGLLISKFEFAKIWPDYLSTLTPVFILGGILSRSIFSGLDVVLSKQFGLLKKTAAGKILGTEFFIGKTIGSTILAFIDGFLIFAVAYCMGFRPVNLAFGSFFMFLIAIFFTGLGITISLKLKNMDSFIMIVSFVLPPAEFLSGATSPLNSLPPNLYFVSRLDPFTYFVDGLRGAFDGMYIFGLPFDLGIVVLLTLIVIIIGTHLFKQHRYDDQK